MSYEIYVTNFGYFYDTECKSVEEAIRVGRDKGFEFSVHEMDGGRMVGFARGPNLQFVNCYDQATSEMFE